MITIRWMTIPSYLVLSFLPPFLCPLVCLVSSDYERSEQSLWSRWNNRTQLFSASILSLCTSTSCARALLTSSCDPNKFEIPGRILAVCCSCDFGLSSLIFFHIMVNVWSPTQIEVLILVRTSWNRGYMCCSLGLVPLPVTCICYPHISYTGTCPWAWYMYTSNCPPPKF